jgi:hypothetical protein
MEAAGTVAIIVGNRKIDAAITGSTLHANA